MKDSNDATGTSRAEQELRTRELQIREREVKNNYRLSIFKVIITGVVATLIPAIINWQIQSQSIEIERLKNEQSYLMDFSKEALQEDLNKRYNFADYLATVAHSDESRKRWEDYRKKIEELFTNEEENQKEIKRLRDEIEAIANQKDSEAGSKIADLQDKLFEAERNIQTLRERHQIQGTPLTSDFEFTEPFREHGKNVGIRFKVRNLNLNNWGNALFVKKGGRITATMEIMHDCQKCGSAINQIIVGIGDEKDAQACVWNGLQSSNGWKPVAFTLEVPETAGVYYVRTRYAQAYGCGDALGWWRIDRPKGPTAESNIGVIVVSP